MNYCKNCQQLLDTKWKACPYCATPAGDEHASQGPEKNITIEGIDFCYIPPGTFMMGSPEDEAGRRDDSEMQHQVRISKGFYMGKYPVTVDQYDYYIDEIDFVKPHNEDVYRDGPIFNVTWKDCVEYCEWLSAKTGKTFRLPTEAEWEYACRAGTQTPFHYGSSLSSNKANFDGNFPYKASKGNYRGKPTPVGFFEPNAFGLFEMHGNIWEWCQDWFNKSYYSMSPLIDPLGPSEEEYGRVCRGGSWKSTGSECRSASRTRTNPSSFGEDLGFRLLMEESNQQYDLNYFLESLLP